MVLGVGVRVYVPVRVQMGVGVSNAGVHLCAPISNVKFRWKFLDSSANSVHLCRAPRNIDLCENESGHPKWCSLSVASVVYMPVDISLSAPIHL